MRVLSRVIPPPMFLSKRQMPEKMVGKRKAAMALVSMTLSRDVLLVKELSTHTTHTHIHTHTSFK